MRVFAALTTGLLMIMPAVPVVAEPELGLLQFKMEHNLAAPGCLGIGSCFLRFEPDENEIAAWLERIARYTDLAVLHWDRGIPWLIFDNDPPAGVDRVAFYDPLLDAPTRQWIDAFRDHFIDVGRGYLAVSILSGERNAVAELHLGIDSQVAVLPTCPDFTPGTQLSVDPGGGPQTFDLERSYRNFVLYLAQKLNPDYLALVVEANLLEETCPTKADGLYSLYRNLYDAVRLEIGPGTPLFATLQYQFLLAYDAAACYPGHDFTDCAFPPTAPPPGQSEAQCYPTNAGAIDALNQGGRLDILALSFYPDSHETNPAPGETPETTAFRLEDWNGGAACLSRKLWPDAVDPLAALDRFNWTGPVAVAETSARSCVSPLRTDLVLPGDTDPTSLVLEIAGSPGTQAAWVGQTLQWARDRDFVFYVHSFLRDYPPVGPWTVDQGVMSQSLQNLFNIWPCSGFEDENGVLKPEIAALGLPEPAGGAGALAAALALWGVAFRRRDERARPGSPRAD